MSWTYLALMVALVAGTAGAAQLKSKTTAAFEAYIQKAEKRLEERKSFLWVDESPERLRLARAGQTVVQPFGTKPILDVPDGLIHDWVGAIFIPRATLQQTLALVEDYNRHKALYQPEVVDSKLLSRDGNDFKVYLRLKKKKVITVVLDTEHDVHYYPEGDTRWRSVSKTTRIVEVEDAGKRTEHAQPPGTGHGFLWKLYSYWRFEQRDGGTWVECEAISLTRDVPTGLGWLIEPIIRNLPRESLENTLAKTRAALVK